MLEELHETHPGCSKMKAIARSYIWWPKMDQEIESVVQKCSVCQESRLSPPTAPLHPWQWPGLPWSRLATSQLCRSIILYGTHVFSHCRCPPQMVGCSHHVINHIHIETLRSVFAIHRLPRIIVTDNGSSLRANISKQLYARMESST